MFLHAFWFKLYFEICMMTFAKSISISILSINFIFTIIYWLLSSASLIAKANILALYFMQLYCTMLFRLLPTLISYLISALSFNLWIIIMKVGRNNIKEVCPAACPSQGHTLGPGRENVELIIIKNKDSTFFWRLYCHGTKNIFFHLYKVCIIMMWLHPDREVLLTFSKV